MTGPSEKRTSRSTLVSVSKELVCPGQRTRPFCSISNGRTTELELTDWTLAVVGDSWRGGRRVSEEDRVLSVREPRLLRVSFRKIGKGLGFKQGA